MGQYQPSRKRRMIGLGSDDGAGITYPDQGQDWEMAVGRGDPSAMQALNQAGYRSLDDNPSKVGASQKYDGGDDYLRDPEATAGSDGGIAEQIMQQAWQLGQEGASWDEVYDALDLSQIESTQSPDYAFGHDISSIQMAHEAGMRGEPFHGGRNSSKRPGTGM